MAGGLHSSGIPFNHTLV